ncbi:MAG: shikimate dehydrogenase family protein [Microbacteriaceae bacterium]
MANRFAVLGSPIAHSRSPLLHRAAISALGVDAEYSAVEVTEADFSFFLASQDADSLGFSLTMPLKHVVRPFLTSECEVSTLTGSVNTIIRGDGGWHGFNTDVWGAQTAIAQSLGTQFQSATVLGSGATASSIVAALHALGVAELTVVARDTAKAASTAEFATRLGMSARGIEWGTDSVQSDILVNTLPGSVTIDAEIIEDLDAAALFDVVYDPWPTSLAREWAARGLPSSNGLLMLLWQAVRQARIFYGESIDEELPNEQRVITAMRSAVGL